jgi:hypothetical protein
MPTQNCKLKSINNKGFITVGQQDVDFEKFNTKYRNIMLGKYLISADPYNIMRVGFFVMIIFSIFFAIVCSQKLKVSQDSWDTIIGNDGTVNTSSISSILLIFHTALAKVFHKSLSGGYDPRKFYIVSFTAYIVSVIYIFTLRNLVIDTNIIFIYTLGLWFWVILCVCIGHILPFFGFYALHPVLYNMFYKQEPTALTAPKRNTAPKSIMIVGIYFIYFLLYYLLNIFLLNRTFHFYQTEFFDYFQPFTKYTRVIGKLANKYKEYDDLHSGSIRKDRRTRRALVKGRRRRFIYKISQYM